MKNRKKLRHITLTTFSKPQTTALFPGEQAAATPAREKKKYLWNYYYDDMDLTNYPYSYYLFVPKHNRRLKVRVYFTKYAPQMKLDAYLTKGTLCLYKGRQVELNLCRPYYAGQMIEYVFRNCCQDTDVGELNIMDGDAILERLGYSDFY